ncbi:MAG: filamentous hemagglutinin N-terminal domain-containing protein [Nitrospirae bacterium]|nr:filamentous hemagglutinin N-terminal domain-containing protein [Nitrospirota bacterium]
MKRTRTDRRFSLGERIVAGVLSVLLPLTTLPDLALALPHGGVVAKGQATLGYSTGRLLITQTTSSATFDWGSFTVKSGQSVVYKTPGSSSVSMNYIGGTTPSSIDGRVTSNGILYFMNPNGLIFGSGSVVSAAGVMAFGAGTPWGKPTGAVSNAGVLTATDNGTVALVGSSVTNTGTITAPGGEVLLAAGSTVTPISATEGSSLSVATTGGGLVDDSGILSAETTNGKTGTILLQSGMETGTTTLASTAVLDASAPNGGNGGKITVNGNTVTLDNVAPLNVAAPFGTKGTVTIDPSTINTDSAACLETIDGNQSSYLADTINLTGNIDLESGSTPYNWTPLGTSSSSAFTGTFNGNGHVVSGYTIGTSTKSYSANCDAGFIGYLESGGKVENLGVSGTIYANNSYCVGGVVGANFGMVENSYNTGSVTGHRYVGGVVGDNCGTGAIVENSSNTGKVSGDAYVGGVVGYNCSGKVEYSSNTGSVTGSGSSDDYVGGVVGYNNGTGAIVENSYNMGKVSGCGYVGGLVGDNSSGTVESSYNTGSVSGKGFAVGGLVGCNDGMVTTSYNTGSVTGSSSVGGGVGVNYSNVESSYNTGSITGSYCVGGVVGSNSGSAATVQNTYYNTSVAYGSGAIGHNSGTSTNNIGISGPSFGTGSNLSNLGTFNTWNSSTGAFNTTPVTSAPWIMGTITTGGESIVAPILVSDMGTATVTANSVSMTYSGLPYSLGSHYTTTGATLSGTVADSTSSVNTGTFTITPVVTALNSPTQTDAGFFAYVKGTLTITPATLTVTANSATMTYGGKVPTLSGRVTGFVNGQTLAGDSGSATWSTLTTSSSSPGQYGITGNVTLGSPYSGDYTITQASGNATALTVTGGITSTHFAPVAQTAALTLSGSGTSISGNSSDSGGSPSSTSEDSITLSSGSGTSLSVVSTGGGDPTGDGILSSQEVKP